MQLDAGEWSQIYVRVLAAMRDFVFSTTMDGSTGKAMRTKYAAVLRS